VVPHITRFCSSHEIHSESRADPLNTCSAARRKSPKASFAESDHAPSAHYIEYRCAARSRTPAVLFSVGSAAEDREPRGRPRLLEPLTFVSIWCYEVKSAPVHGRIQRCPRDLGTCLVAHRFIDAKKKEDNRSLGKPVAAGPATQQGARAPIYGVTPN